jgi:hypothetical protein
VRTRAAFGWSLAILAGIAWVALAPVAARAAEPTCVTCHKSPDTGQADLVAAWSESIHAESGVSCVDCHGGDPAQAEADRAMSPAAGFKGTIRKVDVPLLCAKCHADAERMKKYNVRIDQYALYLTSEHGKKLAQGDTNVAVCTSCHRSHAVFKATSPKSPSSRRNVPQLCSSCHSNKVLMAPYKLPADEYAKYVKSYHGHLLLEKDDPRAPNCASCHGNHGAEFPGAGSLVEVCHACHAVTADYYKQGPHYQAAQAAGAPLCIHCHGDHDVTYPDASLLVGSEDRHCGQCHEAGSAPLQFAEKLHGRLLDAQAKLDAAAGKIRKAESYGMDPLEAREELDKADSALVETLPVVHTVSMAALEGHFKAVELAASASSRESGAMLADYAKRRKALVVLSIGFVFVMGLLIAKLALVMKDHGRTPPK